MSNRHSFVCAGLFGLAMLALSAVPAAAQTTEVKAKPPMYSYIANWQIPRAHWAEMAEQGATNSKIMEKDLADGTIVGYGNDENLVHQADGETHDGWWSATSMAGLIKVLDQLAGSSSSAPAVLISSTKLWDLIFISRYYNWRPGSVRKGYTSVSSYKLKADAPDDAVSTLSKNLVAPLLEKLLADGTIVEYEVDTMAVHTEAPGTFWISYITPNAEGIDKVNAAIQESLKAQPLGGQAFGSMVDFSAHRDELLETNASYK